MSQLSCLHIIIHYLCFSKEALFCAELKIHISYTVSYRKGENWERKVKYWEGKRKIRRTKSVELFSWEMMWDGGKKLIDRKKKKWKETGWWKVLEKRWRSKKKWRRQSGRSVEIQEITMGKGRKEVKSKEIKAKLLLNVLLLSNTRWEI